MKSKTINCAIITGGSSGIGLAMAELLGLEGTDLILVARRTAKLKEAVNYLRTVGVKSQIKPVTLSIRDYFRVSDLFSPIIESLGKPDLLFNSAGMAYPDYFERIPQKVIDDTITTNLIGTMAFTREILPFMASPGVICSISSAAGFLGTFGYTAYSASKFGIIGFSEALRGELKPKGIHVSVLCPSDTDTPQLLKEEETKPEETKAIAGNVTVMDPSSVARAALKGIKNKQFMIIPGFSSKFYYWINRLLPGLVRIIMDREINKIQKKMKQSVEI